MRAYTLLRYVCEAISIFLGFYFFIFYGLDSQYYALIFIIDIDLFGFDFAFVWKEVDGVEYKCAQI